MDPVWADRGCPIRGEQQWHVLLHPAALPHAHFDHCHDRCIPLAHEQSHGHNHACLLFHLSRPQPPPGVQHHQVFCLKSHEA